VRYQSAQFARGGLFIAVSLLLTACTVGPKYQRPTVQPPLPIYKEAGDWKPAQPNELSLGGKWWEIFGDPQLNVLEEKINVSNQNLKTAEAQFREARAALRYARADYYPTITASPSATRNRVSANRPPNNSVFNGITTNDFILPFDLSYQADVWGRVRRNVESFREQAQASAADLATINLSLHADLAVDYFQARSLDAQEKLLLFTVSQYEEYLQLTENRFNGGLASEVEVQQARTQLETTRAQAVDVGVLRAQFEHAVATLIGESASTFDLPPLPLATPPPVIPIGVPSALLERRPDIAAAERRVASANAQIGVAKAAYYPQLNLNATGGFESGVITTLFSGPSILWSAGPQALVTVFDVGRRRSFTDEAIAAHDAQVAIYRQTVLTAFQQVEDSLAAGRVLEQEAKVQDVAVSAARRSLDLSTIRYKGGVTSYLEVILAQNAALADEITAVNILGRRMVSAVQLIQALGGGWDISTIPQRPECCGKLVSTNDKP